MYSLQRYISPRKFFFFIFAYCSSLLFLVGPNDVPNTFAFISFAYLNCSFGTNFLLPTVLLPFYHINTFLSIDLSMRLLLYSPKTSISFSYIIYRELTIDMVNIFFFVFRLLLLLLLLFSIYYSTLYSSNVSIPNFVRREQSFLCVQRDRFYEGYSPRTTDQYQQRKYI